MTGKALPSTDVWRIILHGDQEPHFNMALDQALLDSVVAGRAPPTLRFYGWTKAAITVGYHQNPEKVLNMEAVRAAGIEVLKRPTGGRAVLHGDDLTYSITLPRADLLASSVIVSYRSLSEALAAGLAQAGVHVTLARGKGIHMGPGPQPCFTSTARYELTSNGRKLVGSAQRRMRGGLLQQGSIPLRDGGVRLRGLLPDGLDLGGLENRWTTVEEITGRAVECMSLASAVAEGFCRQWGARMVTHPPHDDELRDAQRIVYGGE